MLTAPYGTPLSGLCRYDDLILKYAPTASAPRGAEQPVRPYGIEAEAWFHAIRAPIAELAPPKAAAAVWDDDCDKLSTTPSAFWFRAPSAEDAARAVNLLFAATSALKSGRVRTTDCADFARWKMTCEQMVLDRGRIDQITHVSPCPADKGLECYTLSVGGFVEVTIKGLADERSLSPSEIQSVSAAEYVVVT